MEKYHYTGGGANRTLEEVSFLKKKYELFNTELLADIFDRSLGLKVIGYEKPKNVGLPHVTYIVHFDSHEDMIFRSNLGPNLVEVELLKEKLVADLVKEKGLPTNEIVYVDISRKTFSFDFQIQKLLGGVDAEVEFLGNQNDYDKYSFSLGQLIAKFSEICLPGFGHFENKSIENENLIGEMKTFKDYIFLELIEQIESIKNAGYISQKTSQSVIKIFEDADELFNIKQGSLVHYDLADHNIRYNPKTFEVVAAYDWEASVVGDTFLDLASSPTWKTIYPREKKLIEGFSSVKKLPADYKERMDLYRLRTVIWKIIHNIKFSLVTPERMLRLKSALEPFGLDILS